MRRALAFLVLPLAVFVGGCKSTAQTVGGVRPEKVYSSFVSLSPSTTEIIATNGDRQRLKGRTASDNYPLRLETVPVVASVKPDYEKIQSISPGLIVFDGGIYNAQDIEKIKSLGPDVYVIDADTIDGFCDQLYRLAAKIGAETNMSSYIDKIVSARTSALGDPITPTPTVAVMLAGGGGANHMIAGTKSFYADVVAAAGAKAVGPESNKFEMSNAEFLLSQNPTFILLGVSSGKDEAAKQVEAILKDPRFGALEAVKQRKIIAVNQDVLVRRGTRVDVLIERVHRSLAGKS